MVTGTEVRYRAELPYLGSGESKTIACFSSTEHRMVGKYKKYYYKTFMLFGSLTNLLNDFYVFINGGYFGYSSRPALSSSLR